MRGDERTCNVGAGDVHFRPQESSLAPPLMTRRFAVAGSGVVRHTGIPAAAAAALEGWNETT
jgi:hypothetical protein